ncbi:MAG: DUF116 domain-containing protein [Nitrospirota bacterium]|jgi:hypothetical protein
MTEISTKRLLFGLSLVTFILLSAIAFGLYFIPYRRLADIHPVLPSLFLLVIGSFLGLTAFGLFTLTRGVTRGRVISHAESLRNAFFKFFYPIMASAGKMLRISKLKIQQVFIDVNNLLIRSNPRYVKPERLLLLLPHCLQFDECNIRIIGDIYRCIGCGKCEIKDLAEIGKKANIHLSVATGGGLARRIVEERRPEAVIAVACERDLSSGIIDTYPLPVIGIVNQRPYGYCLNTMVDLTEVKDALRYFTGL